MAHSHKSLDKMASADVNPNGSNQTSEFGGQMYLNRLPEPYALDSTCLIHYTVRALAQIS